MHINDKCLKKIILIMSIIFLSFFNLCQASVFDKIELEWQKDISEFLGRFESEPEIEFYPDDSVSLLYKSRCFNFDAFYDLIFSRERNLKLSGINILIDAHQNETREIQKEEVARVLYTLLSKELGEADREYEESRLFECFWTNGSTRFLMRSITDQNKTVITIKAVPVKL
jgi:hypothetical protein